MRSCSAAAALTPRSRAYWDQILERVQAIPSVLSVASVLHLPAGGRKWMGPVAVEGRALAPDQSPVRSEWQVVSTGYFKTAGIPVLKGRSFDRTDGPDVPLVIAVNVAFSWQVFPNEDPLGKKSMLGTAPRTSSPPSSRSWAISGRIASVRHRAPRSMSQSISGWWARVRWSCAPRAIRSR